MTDTIKVTEQELEKSVSLRDRISELVYEIGLLELGQEFLVREMSSNSKKKEELVNKFAELQVEEDNLVMEMTKKYGAGSLDLSTGEFTPEK